MREAIDWIKEKRKSIIDPDDAGITEEECELDEGEQEQKRIVMQTTKEIYLLKI